MPNIKKKVTLVIPVSSFYFSTQCNGVKLVLSNLALEQEDAASLTWLVNCDAETELEVQIKEVSG